MGNRQSSVNHTLNDVQSSDLLPKTKFTSLRGGKFHKLNSKSKDSDKGKSEKDSNSKFAYQLKKPLASYYNKSRASKNASPIPSASEPKTINIKAKNKSPNSTIPMSLSLSKSRSPKVKKYQSRVTSGLQ